MALALMKGFKEMLEVISSFIIELKSSEQGSIPIFENTLSRPRVSMAKQRAAAFEMDCVEKKLSRSPQEQAVPSRVVIDRENNPGAVCTRSGIYEAGVPSSVLFREKAAVLSNCNGVRNLAKTVFFSPVLPCFFKFYLARLYAF
jgi:hypothetical protein